MAQGKEMEAILKIVGNLDPSLEKAVSGATKAISGIGKGMAVAGGAVVAGLAAATTAAVAFGAEAVKAASSYEQAFANASTLMQGTPEELQKISDEIISVSNETGIAAEEISNATYSALSAGIDQADAVEFVGKSAKLAAAGFTDVDTAMSAVAKTMNAYGMDASHTDDPHPDAEQRYHDRWRAGSIPCTGNAYGSSFRRVLRPGRSFPCDHDCTGYSHGAGYHAAELPHRRAR